MKNFFTAKNVSAGYGAGLVIDNISFTLGHGSILGILGANGSGKTTLLKAICGILPHTGNCTLEDTSLENLSIKQLSCLCGYIPQRSGINIDLPVLEIVLMGFNPRLGLLSPPTPSMREAAVKAISAVGMKGYENTDYLKLSEGQKQLVILARVLVSESRLLLLDEPESALDFRHRYGMLRILREYITAVNGSAVVSLHDPSLALNYCDRLLILDAGKVLGVADPHTDPLEKTGELLTKIYGEVSLRFCETENGRKHIVMLHEGDF